jgi:hypothetical protein
VVAVWHNRLIVAPELVRRYRRKGNVYAMVSTSNDGALVSRFVEMLGMNVCRGSSSKRSKAVLRELLGLLKSGADVAVTPDGPRGPMYSFQDGLSALALMGHAPVMLVCPNPLSAKRFNSWDGFYLPRPFSTISLCVRQIPYEDLPREREECSKFLRDAFMAMTVDLPDPPRCRQKV